MSTTDQIDEKQLERVQALLAKAEATPYEEEAASYTAKAQQLMARHSIDEAMLRAAQGVADDGVNGHAMAIDNPYASAKSTLLSCIAAANHSRAVWHPARRETTVFGFAVDVANIELLYTSLLLQATRAMLAAGSQVDSLGRVTTRSFRSSFIVAFAYRIGERLERASEQAKAEAQTFHGIALLPVLIRRDEAVTEARDLAFPRLKMQRVSVRSAGGWAAGREAADRANLHDGRPLESATEPR